MRLGHARTDSAGGSRRMEALTFQRSVFLKSGNLSLLTSAAASEVQILNPLANFSNKTCD